jgi:hypothetical protein
MRSSRDNAAELFNEGCVLACAYMWFVLCDQGRSDGEAALIAWAFVASAGASIFGNLALASFGSGETCLGWLTRTRRDRAAQEYLEKRRQNRETITKQLPGEFLRFEAEASWSISFAEAVAQARSWTG